jgi:hypothetical protein
MVSEELPVFAKFLHVFENLIMVEIHEISIFIRDHHSQNKF